MADVKIPKIKSKVAFIVRWMNEAPSGKMKMTQRASVSFILEFNLSIVTPQRLELWTR